jgi:hypothetical protein
MLSSYRGELPEALVLGVGGAGVLRLRGRFASRNGHSAQDDNRVWSSYAPATTTASAVSRSPKSLPENRG